MQSLIKLIIGCILTYHVSTSTAHAANPNALHLMASGYGVNWTSSGGPSNNWYWDRDAMGYPNGGAIDVYSSYFSSGIWSWGAHNIIGCGDQGPTQYTVTHTRSSGPTKYLAIWRNNQSCAHVYSNVNTPQSPLTGWAATSGGTKYFYAGAIPHDVVWAVYVISYNSERPDEMYVGLIDYGTGSSPLAAWYTDYAQ